MNSDLTSEHEEIKALIEGPQVILQRHARSTANASYEELVRKFGDPNDIPYEDLLNNDFNPANRDANTSLVDQRTIRELWFLDDLSLEKFNEEFMLKMKEEFKQTCSSGGQQEHEGSRRADEANGVRRFVNEYIENNQVPKDQKVILVGHYGFFLYYTQEWDKEYSRDQQLPKPEEISTPENCFTMKNSQFLPGVLRILTKTSKIVL